MNTIFPWLISAWEQLVQYKQKQRVPHAVLITGAQGIGKSTLAQKFAHYILCQQSSNVACGLCRSCQLFTAGNHPDYLLIQPEEESNNIKIDQVRKIVQFLDQTKACSEFQVVVINPGEALNRAAANSLLKTLEEPRGSVLILLVSHQPSRLAATIRSRCHQLKVPLPGKQQTLPWLQQQIGTGDADLLLKMADYSPLNALQYAQHKHSNQRHAFYEQLFLLHQKKADPVQVVSQFLAANSLELLLCMSSMMMDLIRIKLQIHDEHITNQDKINEFKELSRELGVIYLFKYLDKIHAGVQLLQNNTNVNNQLLLEQLLISWCYKHDIN